MATSFSNSGEDVVQRCVDAPHVDLGEEVRTTFEIVETARWINQNHFHTVALQFPDELMTYSVDIVQLLSKETSATLAILADTSYGSCCADEVAAEHYKADAIVHYGAACLSPVRRLPVFFVFGRRQLDVDDCTRQLRTLIPNDSQNVLLLYDVVYHHLMKIVESELSKDFPSLHLPVLDLPQFQSNADSLKCCSIENEGDHSISNRRTFVRFGRLFELDTEIGDYIIIFIGSESLFQNACMMTFNKCRFISYDPELKLCKANAWNMNKQLMKRYYLIERARDAERVGLLVGTLGVKDCLAIIERLSSIIRAAGKRCYKFVVGKLNVAKLANFAEVDVYVLVACSENSLIDSSEMYRPVVTPFEMEMACDDSRQWTGDYEVDFRQLLPGGLSYHETTSDFQPRMDVSLVTGKVRQLGIDGNEEPVKSNDSENHALVKSQNEIVLHGSAADFLSNRSWQGLDPQLGKTPVTKAIQGTIGIAMGYQNEPTSS